MSLRPLIESLNCLMEYNEPMTMKVGETRDNDFLRVTLEKDKIIVTDLQYAGLAYRAVTSLVLTTPNMITDKDEYNVAYAMCREFADWAVTAKSYNVARTKAERIAWEFELTDHANIVNVYETSQPGNEVKPSVYQMIDVVTNEVFIRSTVDNFWIKNRSMDHAVTIVPPPVNTIRAIKRFRAWLIDNMELVQKVTFEQLHEILVKAKIHYEEIKDVG